MDRQWVLTACGVISAAGDTPERVHAAVAAGVPLARPSGDAPAAGPLAARIRDFDPKRYLDRKGLANLSRTSQLACAAASRLAPALAGLSGGDVGVVFGSAWASLDTVVRFERAAHIDGVRFVDPLLFTETVANVPAGQVSIFHGWSAVNATLAGGTGAGIAAIGHALTFLEEERARAVVTGGGDEINEHLLAVLAADGEMATPGAPPPGARGIVPGEGACLFALESAEQASARGAGVLGVVRAAGVRLVDAGDAPGRTAFVRGLIESAGLDTGAIDLLVLSANGETRRTEDEARLARDLFGRTSPPAVLPKAVLGETWGVSGPLGLLVALEAMGRSEVPARPAALAPSVQLAGLELPAEPQRAELDSALVLDCAPSGLVAALLVSRKA